jgi:hypothetical protein
LDDRGKGNGEEDEEDEEDEVEKLEALMLRMQAVRGESQIPLYFEGRANSLI